MNRQSGERRDGRTNVCRTSAERSRVGPRLCASAKPRHWVPASAEASRPRLVIAVRKGRRERRAASSLRVESPSGTWNMENDEWNMVNGTRASVESTVDAIPRGPPGVRVGCACLSCWHLH